MRTLGVLFALGLVGTSAAALREVSTSRPVLSSGHAAPSIPAEPPEVVHAAPRFPAGPVPFGGVRGDPPSAPDTPAAPAPIVILDAPTVETETSEAPAPDPSLIDDDQLDGEHDGPAEVIDRVADEDGRVVYRARNGVTIFADLIY